MRISRWEWERSAKITMGGDGTPSAKCMEDSDNDILVVDEDSWAPIAGASLAAYTPKPADVDKCLRATVFLHRQLGRR